MSAVERALLAMLAADAGDAADARAHLVHAQVGRTTGRRERQIVAIATLVVAGQRSRAAGLALEHLCEFPADASLLVHLAPTGG